MRVEGINVNNIRYADGKALIADTKEKIQQLLNAIEPVRRKELKLMLGQEKQR